MADFVLLHGAWHGGWCWSRVASHLRRNGHDLYTPTFTGVPADGDAAIDLLPEGIAHHYHESVVGAGFGWLIPPRSLEVLGVTESTDLECLTPRLTPLPWARYTEAVRLGVAEASVPGAFIECTDWMRVFQPQAEHARGRGWMMHEIATGHEAMDTAPDELASLLETIAAE